MTELFEPIAIIGMAGRFPGAADTGQFWENLRDGREAVAFLSDAELLANGVTPEELADPAYVKAVSLAPDLDTVDAGFFGLTPRDAEICDPQLRVFLEVAHATFEAAGYDPHRIADSVGVFGSTGPSRYADMYVTRNTRYAKEPINLWTLNNIDYLSTLVSYKFNLRGPSYTMATACSSSLVAIHLACQSLRLGECDYALAGGSTMNLPYGHGYYWAPGGVRSPDGHCRPFDVAGTGTIFGDGAAAVLLKRLSDAVADGDHVDAVIRGTAINNDGADKVSFSAPSVTGQAMAIMEAMAVAGCDPRDISCVEAHGTGTGLGDPVEVAALTTAYRNLGGGLPDLGSIPIGSVKSNVGHLVWAAGVTSLIKVTLGMAGEHLPANINFSTPNPKIEIEKTPFFVNDELRPWPRQEGRPRRAGISSLGIGGTNAHVVVEEAPAPAPALVEPRARIVVWSGRDRAAVTASRAALTRYFAENGEQTFADATATLQRGRAAHPVREAVVAGDAAEAAGLLGTGTPITAAGPVKEAKPVTFLFPGQGAQHAGMATGLYGSQPVFTETIDACLASFEDRGLALHDIWMSEEDSETLRPTRLAQPLLFSVEYAMARTWIEWGVEPAALLGHSVGEIVAATVAGVFTLDEAVAMVAARGEAMQSMAPGGMLALAMAEEEARRLLPETLVVAVVNPGPQTVVAGPLQDVTELAERLRRDNVPARLLATSHAFHSPAMRDAVPLVDEALGATRLRPPRIPLYSAASGERVTDEQACDPRFWTRQIAEPVLFARAFDHLRQGSGLLLEVGPGQTLTKLVGRDPAVRPRLVASLGSPESRRRDDERDLLTALSRLWVEGADVDWERFNAREPMRRVEVPGYPYQRRRFWVEPSFGPGAPRHPDGSLVSGAAELPVLEPAGHTEPVEPAEAVEEVPFAGLPFTSLTWFEQRRPAGVAGPREERLALALVPEDKEDSLPFVLALQQAGHRAIRVRPGTEYRASGQEFSVRPGEPADLRRLVEDLERTDRWPDLLVHAWGGTAWPAPTADSVDGQLDLAFFGLMTVIQEMGRRSAGLPGVLVLTTRLADVSGGEPVDPVKAATHGLVGSLVLETPGLACTVIDVGPGTPEDELIDEISLAATAKPADGAGLVALRGSRRWVRRETPWEPVGEQGPIRREGVYLVTGGLGGLGLAVAKGLAQTGKRPRLVLLGRTGLPDKDDPRFEAVTADIEEMESLGARVRVVACDVADRRGLGRALDVATAHFGAINGVLHLAGNPGDGMVQFRSQEDARDVLRPKVLGTVVLGELLAARQQVDFFVSFASRAGLRGMVGSADYAAGNAFLDAWSAAGGSWARRHLSIDWPFWTKVGMGAMSPPGHGAGGADVVDTRDQSAGQTVFETEMSAATHWALDEHRFGGRAVLPGAGQLDLVVRAFRKVFHDSAAVPVVVEEAVFERVLIGDAPRAVQVVFQPEDGWQRFRVRSRPAGEQGAWTTHVTGRVAIHERHGRDLDLEEVRAGLPAVQPPSYVPTPTAFLALGPRWQLIDGMWAAEGTRLVDLRLPEAFHADLADHPLHPAMLDLATVLVRDEDRDPSHLPFLYRRLVLHEDLPAHVLSHIRRRPDTKGVIVGDIDIVAPDGRVLVEIEGFTMRLLKDRSFVDESDPEPAPENTPRDGLDPDTGVGLFLTLLEARTLPQVVVRPFRGGHPVPLEDDGRVPAVVPVDEAATVVTAPAPGTDPETRVDAPPAASEGAAIVVADAVEAMWKEAIGVTELAETDDFFDIGGDSLSAVQVMTRIRDTFGVELSIGLLFDHPTLGALSGVVRDRLGD